MSPYQQFIHQTRYARWLETEKRRETWEETVDRYINFFKQERANTPELQALLDEAKQAILAMQVMPSMRALMTAGEALKRENIAGYNCCFIAINNKRAFAEALYVLMCGTGVGFSCERQEVAKLPVVPESLQPSDDVIVVGDSKEGWAKAYAKLLSALYTGDIPQIDYSKLRPQGARLKTFGGRASGSKPLQKLFEFTINKFKHSLGKKLTSIDVHDIMCMVGEIVVVGGVRRSALISLSNLSDHRMRDAKSGQWWQDNPQRGLSNNSVAYTEKPSAEIFMEEWLALVKSKSGERGIFNRVAAQNQAAKYGRRNPNVPYGTNPCCEVILRDKQFCNLTEVIVRVDDDINTLSEKVRIATILGTFQASLTKFNFLSETWTKNTEEEALLGVSMTGIMDNLITSGQYHTGYLEQMLEHLRSIAVEVNKQVAELLGIKPSAAITCVKPSGTVSQLCDTASGIHARHNSHYIRTVRIDKKDPVYALLKHQGIPIEDDVMRPDSTAVVSFPQVAPQGCVTRNDMTALEQLELWLIYQRNWCEHKPSVTITVKEDEWVSVGAWVYEHFDEVSGISFLPHSDHTYQQAPYQDMTEESLNQWIKDNPSPVIDWSMLPMFEKEDETVSSQTLACVSGHCEI